MSPARRKPGPFWRRKTLEEMTPEEWESLCDGCGKCCLIKLEDPDTAELSFTDIACRLLDAHACRCTDYKNRSKRVRGCVRLTAQKLRGMSWLPSTCAYRLVAEGRDLYWWHPLVSGDPESVHAAGMSVRGRTVPEGSVKDEESRIVDWPR
jgi:uncharacterized cysteine cluster protein YcgN (CxxCxxCC family)